MKHLNFQLESDISPLKSIFEGFYLRNSHKASFKRWGGEQPGQMGVAIAPNYIICRCGSHTHTLFTLYRGCLLDTQRKKVWDSYQKCFYHHAFNVGYDDTNVFYSAIKVAKGVRSLPPKKLLQSIIFDIEKSIKGYQVIKFQSHGRAGQARSLNWGYCLSCHPLALWLPRKCWESSKVSFHYYIPFPKSCSP